MKYNYKPSLKELRSSFKYRSREYLLQNTLHGVPYFVDPTRPKWERLMWFFLTLASIIAIFGIIVTISEKFQTEPTITGLDIMTEHIDIEFPQVFICFDWAQLNHSNVREWNIMYLYEHLYNWTWGEDIDLKSFDRAYQNKNNIRSVFKMIQPECNYFITDCSYRGVNMSCSELFTKVLTSVGACCKSKNLRPLRIIDPSWNLEFRVPSSSFPLRFYFSDTGSEPRPGERSIIKAYFPVDIEFIVDITYTTSDVRYLLLRQRKCYYKQEGINFNDCEISCIINKFIEHCNCVPWFLSFADKAECPLRKYSCLNEVAVDNIQCNCWLPCNHTSYSVKGIKKSLKNVNRIMLRNWPTALYKREMRFGYLDLLVSFGGIASLFLGYSLLTSVEFGYYFSLRTYFGAAIQSSRKQYNIVTIYVVEKPWHKRDIKPKYYQYVD